MATCQASSLSTRSASETAKTEPDPHTIIDWRIAERSRAGCWPQQAGRTRPGDSTDTGPARWWEQPSPSAALRRRPGKCSSDSSSDTSAVPSSGAGPLRPAPLLAGAYGPRPGSARPATTSRSRQPSRLGRYRVNSYGLRVIVIVLLASNLIFVGGRSALAQARSVASGSAALPNAFIVAQAAPAPAPPIALPRVRDYEAIPELRDVHFDFGKAVTRPGEAGILDANAAWLRAHPEYSSSSRGTVMRGGSRVTSRSSTWPSGSGGRKPR